MFSQEQLEDDETAKSLLQLAFRQIDRQHVAAYAKFGFSKPSELTAKERKETTHAVLQFATFGWVAFHAMNRGAPFKERETKQPAKKQKTAKKSKRR